MAACVFARLVLLVALYVTYTYCNSDQCDHWSPHADNSDSAEDDIECFNPKGVDELGCDTMDPVVWWNVNISDQVLGEMAVDFLLFSDPGSYQINLEYSDATSETCHHDSAHFKLHSSRDFIVSSVNNTDVENSTCQETGREWFSYVYTGCYRVSFLFYLPDDGGKLYKSCPTFLVTNYTKKLLDKPPVLNPQYYHKHSTLRLTVEMGQEIHVVQVNVKLSSDLVLDLGTDVCQKSGSEDVCCSHKSQESPPAYCRKSKPNYGKMACYIENTSLECVVGNVEPGDYCMMVSIRDDRCYPDTVWMDHGKAYVCRWYLQFRANETSSSRDVVTFATDSWTKMLLYWCVAIMFVLILAGVAVAFWLCSKDSSAHRRDVKEISSRPEYCSLNPKKPSTNQGPAQVLLLYALDCNLFMDLMAVFRNNLKKLGFKVHDCFDLECQERVAKGPTQWLRNLLSRPEVKVVIVSSECAQRRQLALDSCTPLCYAQPHPYSSLFICALEYLLREGRRESYEREYHVRFHKFTDERHMLAHVTPLRIYTLPKHFSLLLQNLNNKCDVADAEVDIEDNNVFDEPLDKLVKYKAQNPNYLDQLLLRCAGRSRTAQCGLPGKLPANQWPR